MTESILIALNTYNGYISLLPQVWSAINNLIIPNGYTVDYILFTEDTEDKVIEYAKNNSITIYTSNTDFTPINGFKTNIDEINIDIEKSLKTVYRVITMLNLTLNKAIEGNYDWLLSIDGDIIPPIDGLQKLLSTGKRYIGARVESKIVPHNYYVRPENLDITTDIFRCIIIGNCFLLSHKDTFSTPYSLDDEPIIGGPIKRCKELRKQGVRLWCHPDINCQHLVV